jgi:hypothetical protein
MIVRFTKPVRIFRYLMVDEDFEISCVDFGAIQARSRTPLEQYSQKRTGVNAEFD